jgi:hypothetical protein
LTALGEKVAAICGTQDHVGLRSVEKTNMEFEQSSSGTFVEERFSWPLHLLPDDFPA